MPGNVQTATVSGVLPWAACSSMRRTETLEWRSNELSGGERVVALESPEPRRRWEMSRDADQSELNAMITFYRNHRAAAFYFYDVADTVGCSYDATGNSATGRFKCVFAGPLDVVRTMGAPEMRLVIEEVL